MLKKRFQLHRALALLGCLAALVCEGCGGEPFSPPADAGFQQVQFLVEQPTDATGQNFEPVPNLTIHGDSLTPPLTIKDPDQITDQKGQAFFNVQRPGALTDFMATYEFTLSKDGKVLKPLKYSIDKGNPLTSTDGKIKVDVSNAGPTIAVGVMLLKPVKSAHALPGLPAGRTGKPLPPPDNNVP